MRFPTTHFLAWVSLFLATVTAFGAKVVLTPAQQTERFAPPEETPEFTVSLDNYVQIRDVPETLVRVDTTSGTFYIKLLEQAAPQTADNFLTYVRNGDYDNMIFHRSIENFIIQTGELFLNEDEQLSSVADHGTVPNEPGVSNTTGTVALAKVPGDANSGTNNWFINLSNNSDPLDTQNSGFTVFGNIYSDFEGDYDGMVVVNQLAEMPVWDASDVLGLENLPLQTSFDGFGVLKPQHFLTIHQMSVVEDVGDPEINFVLLNNPVSNYLTASISDRNLHVSPASEGTAIPTLNAEIEIGVTDADGDVIDSFTKRIQVQHQADRVIVGSSDNTNDFWNESGWFGWYEYSRWPWIYHNEHGWIWVGGVSSGGGLWYWEKVLGWTWSSPSLFPYLYSAEYTQWIYYYEGGIGAERWFQFYGEPQSVTASWESALPDWPSVQARQLPKSQ